MKAVNDGSIGRDIEKRNGCRMTIKLPSRSGGSADALHALQLTIRHGLQSPLPSERLPHTLCESSAGLCVVLEIT